MPPKYAGFDKKKSPALNSLKTPPESSSSASKSVQKNPLTHRDRCPKFRERILRANLGRQSRDLLASLGVEKLQGVSPEASRSPWGYCRTSRCRVTLKTVYFATFAFFPANDPVSSDRTSLPGPTLARGQQYKRRFPRYHTELKLTVSVLGPRGHFEVTGLCNQIGEAGLGAIIARELAVAEVVDLQFSIPSEPQPISVRAVVRWRDRLQHGFEFFGISSELRDRIREYCKDLTEQDGV